MNKLNEKEILYFYDFLYDYEHGNLKGFQEKKFLNKVESYVDIDDQHAKDCNIIVPKDNCLQFSPFGQNICQGVLRHVRNAFAHGNLFSINNNKEFLIQDFSDNTKHQKCNMLGKIEKNKFYDMIDAMKSTKKKTKKKTKKTQ